jgi:integrase
MLVVCMESGMRGGELRQLKRKETLKEVNSQEGYFLSDTLYGKGKGDGKPLEYMLNQTALDAMKMYEKTKDENDQCEYLFTAKQIQWQQVSEGYFEGVCREVLSDIVSRRINEHLFRASCATRLLLQGVSEILVSKYVLHHNDLSTLKHYDLRDFKAEKAQIFGKKNED